MTPSLTPKNIVWLDTSFLGDLVLLSGSINAAQSIWPDVNQYFISHQIGFQLSTLIEPIKATLKIDKKKFSIFQLRSQIKKFLKSHDISSNSYLMLSHQSFRTRLLGYQLGIPTVGFGESLWLSPNYSVPYVEVLHEVQRKAVLLEALGVAREAIFEVAKPKLTIDEALVSENTNSLISANKDRPYVLIFPGSVWATKIWPREHFVELIALMKLVRPDIKFFLCGSSKEKILGQYIFESLRKRDQSISVDVLMDQINFSDLATLVAHASLVVSNDSAPVHFASAFNTPCLALFGPTVPSMGFGPLSSLSASVGVDLSCRPCGKHGANKCPLEHFHCMKLLVPQTVADRALSLFHNRVS